MTRVRVIVLGSQHAGDDCAALLVADRLRDRAEVIAAGRPGPGLLELLRADTPTVLLDVTQSSAPPGQLVALPLEQLADATLALPQVSSHGFGPSETLELGRALGRALPPGRFIGIEGADFTIGAGLSPAVAAALDDYTRAAITAIEELSPCTKPA